MALPAKDAAQRAKKYATVSVRALTYSLISSTRPLHNFGRTKAMLRNRNCKGFNHLVVVSWFPYFLSDLIVVIGVCTAPFVRSSYRLRIHEYFVISCACILKMLNGVNNSNVANDKVAGGGEYENCNYHK